ncbi:sensor histidine kinase [Sphingomonas oleivorans]|uniref:sensor histidine kinase n=1 Tax=Sphingomonas oleivorans TaxID=1735121 RepID=UPI000D3BBD38|nr:sensor histidine kinase [Sphingomonas oleivorans]
MPVFRARHQLFARAAAILVALLPWSATIASPAGNSAGPALAHRSWTTRTGAPFFIQSLTQDRAGFLWVGSADGLFRFDGLSFDQIAAPPGHRRTAIAASALAAAPNGDVWVGYAGWGGVAVFRNGQLRDARVPDPPAEVTDIAIDADGDPWIAGGDGRFAIMRMHKGKWSPVFGPNGRSFIYANELQTASNGTIWLIADHRVYFARRGTAELKAAPVEVAGIGSLAIDGADMVWLTDERGMWRLPAYDQDETGPPKRLGGPPPPNRYLKTKFDRTGRLWGATIVSGIFHVAAGEKSIHRITERDGLTSDRAYDLFVDRQNNVWVGTERGLDRYSRPVLREEPEIPRNASQGYMLAIDRDGVPYFAAERGIWRALPGQPPELWALLPQPAQALCAGDRAVVWVSMRDSIVRIVDGRPDRRLFYPGRTADQISCAVDQGGTLWVAAEGVGLIQHVGGAWRRYAIPEQLGFPAAVAIDGRNRPVVILARRNLLRLDGSRMMIWHGDRIGFERPLAFSAGTRDLLVGGLTGLLRLRGDRVEKLDFSDHPWLRSIVGATMSADGYVWLTGYRGIIRIRQENLEHAFAHPRQPIPHEIFDDDDATVGIRQRNVGFQAATGGDGRLWFLTRQGVVHVSPTIDRAPPIGVAVRAVVMGNRRLTQWDGLVLPSGTKAVTFEYGAVDLSTPMHRRFRIRLDGIDHDWTAVGTRRQVSFANLGPGRYRFLVQTNDERGAWITPGAGVAFSIAPAFWQTWWFATLVLLATGAVFWTLARWRLRVATTAVRRRIEERLAERERIARELHDTLLQGFQGLMLRFQAVVEQLVPGSRARVALEGALERADDILIEGRERVRALREETEPVDLRARLSALAAEVVGPSPICWTVEEQGVSRKICAPVADEIIRIAGEALTNVILHAGAQNAMIEVNHGRDVLTVIIADDGIGLPADVRAAKRRDGHYGLVGMRERAERLSASITFVNRSDGGTEVRLLVPARIAYQ